jgi:hypothetical protein
MKEVQHLRNVRRYLTFWMLLRSLLKPGRRSENPALIEFENSCAQNALSIQKDLVFL